MKILYFGTVCDLHAYNEKLNQCKEKPSIAPIVFESALLEGLYQNNADVEIHSFPMIPAFPKSRFLFFGGHTERLSCQYNCRWLRTLNVPVLKQISRRLDARKIMKKWMRDNREHGMVMTYSVPPFLASDVIKYAKRYHVKTVAIIPDLLKDMYINDKSNFLVSGMKRIYLSSALRVQGMYDGYIYLTEEMRSVVAPDKPYTVMEGIASDSDIRNALSVEKATRRSVMYAGMLHEKYGILRLLDAFDLADIPDVDLWLFGDGTAAEQVRRRAESNPKIKYFGTRPRSEILQYERQATLLLNPRDPADEFTKYSFPSKTIEYMLSGTPLLTTELKGIPSEYFEHVFTARNNDAQTLALAMRYALSRSDEELRRMGEEAIRFIEKEKNAAKQAAKIMRFLQEVNDENSDR